MRDKAIWKWAGFGLILALLLGMNHALIEHTFRRDASNGLTWMVENEGLDYDIVVLGSSAAHNDVDVHLLAELQGASVLDLSARGSGFAENYLSLDLYLSRHHCRRLVLQVDSWGLSPKSYSYPFHDYLFLPYLDDEVVERHVARYCGTWRTLLWKWVPMWKYSEFNLHFGLKSVWNGLRRREAFQPNSKIVPESGLSRERLERIHKKAPFPEEMCPSLEQYLRNIVELAEAEGLETVMFLAPEYRPWSERIINRGEVVRRYQSIADEHGIPFFVCEDDQLLDNARLFYDPKHLNRNGAAVFSRQLSHFMSARLSPTAMADERGMPHPDSSTGTGNRDKGHFGQLKTCPVAAPQGGGPSS